VAADVIRQCEPDNGLAAAPGAANAAGVRSMMEEAVRLLDDGDIAGTRFLIGAVLSQLEELTP
jgi:hypothetical protein